MAWTTPRTWVVGEVVTSAIMNAHVRDNIGYLHGDAGTTVLAAVQFQFPGSLVSAALYDNSSGTMRAHRHPYGNARHIEAASVVGVAGSGFSYTDAFNTTTPACAIGRSANNTANEGNLGVLNLGASAVQFYNYSDTANTFRVGFVVEGVD